MVGSGVAVDDAVYQPHCAADHWGWDHDRLCRADGTTVVRGVFHRNPAVRLSEHAPGHEPSRYNLLDRSVSHATALDTLGVAVADVVTRSR